MAKEAKKDDPMADLEKKYGKGTIQSFDDSSEIEMIDTISTGSYNLDRAIRPIKGGVPVGRITEIVGPESCGKTTVAVHILKNALKKDTRKGLVLDVEHTFDFGYAQKIGLDRRRITFVQPEYGEMSFDIAKTLIKTGDYSCCVLDSIAANIPKEQHEGETGQSRMARLAALMSMELPKQVPIIHNASCAMILLNQFRNNIGGYGNPEKGAGGESLKYYASVRIDLRKTAEKEDHRNETRAKVFKNKIAPPWGEAKFYIDWGYGINRDLEIIDNAIELEIIKQGGTWFTLEDDQKFHGIDKLEAFLKDNPELLLHYETLINERHANS